MCNNNFVEGVGRFCFDLQIAAVHGNAPALDKRKVNRGQQLFGYGMTKQETNKAWRAANADHVKSYWKAWYERNATKRSEYHKAYHIAHPEVARNNEYQRRAYVENTNTRYTKDEWLSLCAEYGNVCLSCKETKPLEPDHVIPLSKGGTNSIDNIQPLCDRCNKRKYNKTIDYRPTWAKVE